MLKNGKPAKIQVKCTCTSCPLKLLSINKELSTFHSLPVLNCSVIAISKKKSEGKDGGEKKRGEWREEEEEEGIKEGEKVNKQTIKQLTFEHVYLCLTLQKRNR